MSTHWLEEARRLLATGMPVRQIARVVGKGETTVRTGLDINGAYSKALLANRVRKAESRRREREQFKGVRVRVELPAQRIDYTEQVVEQPTRAKPSLPKISLPLLAEEPRRFRIVPAIRATDSPGAERWRQEHLRLLRMGRIAQPGLIEEMRQ